VILITKQTRDEAYYWSSRNKEKRMKHELEILRSKLSEKYLIGQPRITHDLGFNWIPTQNKNKNNNNIVDPIKVKDSSKDTKERSIATMQNNDTGPELEKPHTTRFDKHPMQGLPQTNSVMGQTRLGDFQPDKKEPIDNSKMYSACEGNKKIKIIVDHREFNSTVVRELVGHDVEIEPKQLPIGDYILSERVVVERKLVNDFLQSLIDGRLFAQLKALKNAYIKPLLILEGVGLLTSRKIHSSAIYGALVSVIADFNIPLISTENSKETSEVIRALAAREQLNNKSLPGIRGEKPALTMSERQQFILEGLPNVSATLAQRLLEHFDTVKAVIDADVDELSEVKGIGKKTAEEIKKVIESKYIQ
jgi:Fanconi anemia group M protein